MKKIYIKTTKAVPLLIGMLISSNLAATGTFFVGNKATNIPSPVGYASVKTFNDEDLNLTFNVIGNADPSSKLLDGYLQAFNQYKTTGKIGRWCLAYTPLNIENADLSLSDFYKIKKAIKQDSFDKQKKKLDQALNTINQGLGKKMGIQNVRISPPHHEDETSISFNKVETISEPSIGSESVHSTVSLVLAGKKLLRLECYDQTGGTEHTQEVTRSWVSSIKEANHSLKPSTTSERSSIFSGALEAGLTGGAGVLILFVGLFLIGLIKGAVKWLIDRIRNADSELKGAAESQHGKNENINTKADWRLPWIVSTKEKTHTSNKNTTEKSSLSGRLIRAFYYLEIVWFSLLAIATDLFTRVHPGYDQVIFFSQFLTMKTFSLMVVLPLMINVIIFINRKK